MDKKMDLRNTYIKIKDEAHSREFQNHVFEMGMEWISSAQDVLNVHAGGIIAINDCSKLHYMPSLQTPYSFCKEILFENGVITLADDHIVGANNMVDFSDARVGDKVYCLLNGAGVIDEVIGNDDSYPIFVRFTHHDAWYSPCGKSDASFENPTLYWGKPKIIAPPKPVRMKYIHGHAIPDITFYPQDRDDYWRPNLGDQPVKREEFYSKYSDDVWNAENGFCYPFTEQGRLAAIAHAKALLDYSHE